jgi:Predicted RNA-binding protein
VDDKKYPVDQFGPIVDSFLKTLIGKAGLRLSYEITDGSKLHADFENPDILVRFSGPDVELMLENRAELMLAMEHLTMEMLRMPPEHHSKLCFDANDYRVLRIEELRLSALTAAEKVKKTGVPFKFSPMNSRERRILHLALRSETEVRSESSGVGPNRQVVIYPANMPTPPDPSTSSPMRGLGRARRRSA